ncbi:MAG: putative quinol monooxygenase [Pseudodonghicola sp.]
MSGYYISAAVDLTEGADPEAARAMLADLVRATREEPGCISFDIRQNLEDPRRFTFWECWTGPEALEQHFNYAHTQAVLATGMIRVVYIERLGDLVVAA